MTRYAVVFSADARTQILAVGRWWRENRPSNPGLFLDELRAAVGRLGDVPRGGAVYEVPQVPGLRRLLLPRTAHHVYYTLDDTASVVRIVAVWHTARGARPPL
ncbi:type II toxin-antitoxin system RelE/ParE family toxin [Sorangium sp. So ce1182]|uniref:type II toxin-antitoxin system RelE/ParE family toxin n=1 Tax=Sorangium sp. So ce1182 TaxID=3133334 RepID=UPI003F5E4F61